MKKTILISGIIVITLVLVFLLIKPSVTGKAIAEDSIKLGYCPTMQEESILLAEENNYELIKLGSASEVLYALKNNQIDKAVIGRKAERNELNLNTKETILKSGYTLVSKEKGFISYSELPLTEIYTYLEMSFNFPVKKISRDDITNKIQEGKIVLISWDDWNDDFELMVVMNGNEKVKDFRGVFLYEH